MSKYCSNCGSQLNENADVCLSCGKAVEGNKPVLQTQTTNNQTLYGFLGFCFPIVGLILYLVWGESRPDDAKAAGMGALIGFGLGLLSILLFGI